MSWDPACPWQAPGLPRILPHSPTSPARELPQGAALVLTLARTFFSLTLRF